MEARAVKKDWCQTEFGFGFGGSANVACVRLDMVSRW